MNQNWDVTRYRSPYEPDYQWELRKKFMEQVTSARYSYFSSATKQLVASNKSSLTSKSSGFFIVAPVGFFCNQMAYTVGMGITNQYGIQIMGICSIVKVFAIQMPCTTRVCYLDPHLVNKPVFRTPFEQQDISLGSLTALQNKNCFEQL